MVICQAVVPDSDLLLLGTIDGTVLALHQVILILPPPQKHSVGFDQNLN